MAAARRRRLSATIASLVLALLVLLPVAAQPSAAAPDPPGDSSDGELTITSITTVAEGDDTVTVQGRLANPGSEVLKAPSVSFVPHPAGPQRSDIATWARGSTPVTGTALDRTTLDDIPAGSSAPFVLEVSAEDLLPDVSAGAAWVSIQTRTSAVHTFVGVHRRKEYVPLSLLWGIPLVLPADQRLFDHDDPGRDTAWDEAVGDGSRVAELTATPPADDEAWLLDPSLLDVPEEDPDSRIDASERTVRSERASALRDQVVGSRTLVLPDADADVAAGARNPQAGRMVRPRVSAGAAVADELGARSDVLWPADGLATKDRATALGQLHPDGRTTLLVPGTSVVPEGFTPTGGVRTTDSTPLVVRDGPLSELVAGLGSGDDVLLARQQLVAETASVLRERAGTPRTLVVVPDRDATPDPKAWERLRTTTDDIPWLRKGSLDAVLDEAASADPGRTARDQQQIAAATKGDRARAVVLTGARAQGLLDDQASMTTFASVRSDGPVWRTETLSTIHQLTSTRWRSAPGIQHRLQEQLSGDVELTHDDLVVSEGDVNFFADTGRLQITIVNHTEVELSNLVVRLTPDNPSLRIDGDPDPLTIGPGGRQTVTVTASALAAGQVPVHVTVATPDGQEIAAPATLHVKVRPTGDSIYWIIGGLALLLLLAGTWRSVRGGRRRAGAEVDPTEES
ncbi:MAG: DUF6049 family protein [Janibacter sp.]|nr:DUF6049 family protein [Janibacter sp.]